MASEAFEAQAVRGRCLDDDTVIDFIEHLLPDRDEARVKLHLDACEECRSTVAETAKCYFEETQGAFSPEGIVLTVPSGVRRPEAAVDGTPYIARGAAVGRYVVIGPIGSGGMGVVYRAHDPELNRTVALKLLRSDRASESSHARLLREARAMALLSHPNVVYVHDAGTYEGRVFVAMEFVEGMTLREWLHTPRSWVDVLGKMIDAGRGIAAAHRANLVHLDIKPDNVLIGVDGRARMTDFGLARSAALRVPAGVAEHPRGPSEPARLGERDSAGDHSRTGGTPAYLAPERLLGQVGAQSDQFSFCVTLYLALFGRHPFEGRTLGELWANMADNNIRKPPDGSTVPIAVLEALTRGLRADPKERFATIDALLDALADTLFVTLRFAAPRARNRTKSRIAAVAILAGVSAIVAAFLVGRSVPDRPTDQATPASEPAHIDVAAPEPGDEDDDAPAEASSPPESTPAPAPHRRTSRRHRTPPTHAPSPANPAATKAVDSVEIEPSKPRARNEADDGDALKPYEEDRTSWRAH
jgi:serine/threonine protein kinase